jgi:REP element-mobilizing transposase RayT
MVMVTNERRRSIRLKDYDYAQVGAYFVTIVVQDRKCLFGEIIGGVLQLNAAGLMVQAVWEDLSNHYAGIDPDAFVVMPNHIHGIVVLVGTEAHAIPTSEGQPQGVAPTRTGAKMSLSDVVHRFKTLTTKRYIEGVKRFSWASFATRLWQRNYFEHVIRNDESLQRIRQYIHENPARWEFDRENPLATRPESKDTWRTGQ